MNLNQIVIIIVAGLILLTFIVLSIIANHLLNSLLVPASSGWKKSDFGKEEARKNASEEDLKIYAKMDALKKISDRWVGNTNHQDLWTQSFDNLKLHGLLYTVEDSHKYAIIVHGYKGSVRSSGLYGSYYFEKGFNVLLIENRASGMSEGKAVTLGALEKKDIQKWTEQIVEMDKDAKIVIHGESMGAAAVMMATGEILPPNVQAAIADCGYTSIWDELSYLLKTMLHKPVFPILYFCSAYSKIRFGFGFKSSSSVKALSKSKTPVLIMHGGEDTFVPTKMAKLNYVAITSKKDWFIMPQANHRMSAAANPEVYWARIWEFLGEQ